jgi:hypothetical protein
MSDDFASDGKRKTKRDKKAKRKYNRYKTGGRERIKKSLKSKN